MKIKRSASVRWTGGIYPSDLKMRVSEPLGVCNARQPGEAMSSTL